MEDDNDYIWGCVREVCYAASSYYTKAFVNRSRELHDIDDDDVRYIAELDLIRKRLHKFRFPEIYHPERPPNFNRICGAVFNALLEDREFVEFLRTW